MKSSTLKTGPNIVNIVISLIDVNPSRAEHMSRVSRSPVHFVADINDDEIFQRIVVTLADHAKNSQVHLIKPDTSQESQANIAKLLVVENLLKLNGRKLHTSLAEFTNAVTPLNLSLAWGEVEKVGADGESTRTTFYILPTSSIETADFDIIIKKIVGGEKIVVIFDHTLANGIVKDDMTTLLALGTRHSKTVLVYRSFAEFLSSLVTTVGTKA